MTDGDDDKTVLVKRAQQALAGATAGDNALPPGTQLAEFRILGLIGVGGFGIVYLAYDTKLERNVALKEYFPRSLAARAGDMQMTVRSTRHEETLAAGLKCFIKEARLLAKFDHHSLVNVYRFWEANGTAYMVMPYYDGVTLKEALHQMREPPSEAWLRNVLAPLLEALEVLHNVHCCHRDIAPDNIMLLKGSGRPVLLDFGAARRVISDMSQALTVILKPGYAPVEQYEAVASMKQGPWTDLYALAAVVYCAIQGTTPPAAVGRLMSDTYVPLAKAAAGRYSDAFLRAIDHALAVRPEDRPQSVEAFANELGLDLTEHGPSVPPPHLQNAPPAAGGTVNGSSRAPTQTWSGAPASKTPTRAPVAPSASRIARTTLYAAAAVILAALAGTFGWHPLRTPAPHPATENQSRDALLRQDSRATPTVAATASDATSAMPSAVTPPPVAADIAASAQAPASSPVTGGAAVSPTFNPAAELQRIAALSDPAIRVTATLRKTIARVDQDPLQFRVMSNRGGYLYLFSVDPAGQYLMLFPNKLDGNNVIRAGRALSLPRSNWSMTAAKPLGPNHFLALVSPVPRDFSAGGLRQGPVFAEFSASAQQEAAGRRTTTYSPFAGEARCAPGAADCASNFGATTFEIDVVSNAVPSQGPARQRQTAVAAQRARAQPMRVSG